MFKWLTKEAANVIAAYNRWEQDDGASMAAAVAYYLGLALFPLLIVLVAGVGLFLRFTNSGQHAEHAVLDLVQFHVSAAASAQVQQALDQVQDRSRFHGPIAFFMMLFSSIAGFVELQRAFDRIWNVPNTGRRGVLAGIRMVLFERWVAFVMLCALGFLITAVFIAGIVLSAMEHYAEQMLPGSRTIWGPMQISASFVLNAGLFTLIYRWLPKKPASLWHSFRGGLMAATTWEIGRQILAALLIGTKYTDAYGVVGSFIGLMLWCYYAVAVLLLGAEYIQVTSNSGVDPKASGVASSQTKGSEKRSSLSMAPLASDAPTSSRISTA
jgi:membrane protein